MTERRKRGASGGFLKGELAVGKNQLRVSAVQYGIHGNVAAPELADVPQCFLGVFELQVAPVVMVLEQQGAAVGVIGILDFDDRNGRGADVLNQRFFNLAPRLLYSNRSSSRISSSVR